MQMTIDETNRRRAIQIEYNTLNRISPTTIFKSKEDIMNQKSILDIRGKKPVAYVEPEGSVNVAADPIISYMNKDQITKLINETESRMKKQPKTLILLQLHS